MNRSVVIALNILRQIRNDRRTLGMIIVTPIIVMVLFGYAFAGDPKGLNVAVVMEDTGRASFETTEGVPLVFPVGLGQRVIDSIDTDTLTLSAAADLDAATAMISDGRAWGAVYIPANFTQDLVSKALQITNTSTFQAGNRTLHIDLSKLHTDQAFVATYLDNSNTQVGALIQRKISEAFTTMLQSLPYNVTFTNVMHTDFIYGADAKFVDFFAPGIMSFVITMITIMLTIVSIVRERTNGTMDRIFASPTKPHEVVLGYSIAFTLISLIQACLLLGSAILLFNMTIQGNVILALGFILLYAIGMQGLGTLLSTIAKNEFQAIQLVPLVFVPFILLGGIFWPVEAMPSFIKPLSSAIPLTYAAEGLRSIIIRGWGPIEIWKDLLALVIFAVVMSLASMAVTRHRARA